MSSTPPNRNLAEQRAAQRVIFLNGCYEAASGMVGTPFNCVRVGTSLGFDIHESKNFATEFARRGYIEGLTFDDSAFLTPNGLDAVEGFNNLPSPIPSGHDIQSMSINATNSSIVIGDNNEIRHNLEKASGSWLKTAGEAGIAALRRFGFLP